MIRYQDHSKNIKTSLYHPQYQEQKCINIIGLAKDYKHC